jgi:3-oxoacyl-[acyl-carrier protein] reductase
MKGRFEGRHVLITGGGRGIGLEIAQQFGREGARVSIFDRAKDLLDDCSLKLNKQKISSNPFHVDVSRVSEVVEAVREVEAIAPIDVLVNNAGIARETPFLDIEEEEWRSIIDINLTGYFFVAQSVCRYMVQREKGVVLNMASKNGLTGEFGYCHYDASKGGVIMLTKTMSLELAHFGIRVNALCPGYLVTPMSSEIDSPEFVERFVDRYIPMNRPGKVDDVAPLCLFLASDEASFITGQTFVIDGGQLAGQKPGQELLRKMES